MIPARVEAARNIKNAAANDRMATNPGGRMKIIRSTVLSLLLAVNGLACDGASDRLTAGSMAYIKGDYKTALRKWRPLAEQGNAGAQLNLGQLYRQGQGVPQDYKEAMKWYHRAAEQGYGIAQNNLGYMYGKGDGVPQDNVQAHMWFIIAGASGDKSAMSNRDKVAEVMTPAEIAESQTLAREWMEKHQKGEVTPKGGVRMF